MFIPKPTWAWVVAPTAVVGLAVGGVILQQTTGLFGAEPKGAPISAQTPSGQTRGAVAGGSTTPQSSFTVRGDVSGLVSGQSPEPQLTLAVTNSQNFAIRVTELTVNVGTPTGRHISTATPCSAGDLSVPASTPVALDIAAGATATYALPIHLAPTAGDGCREASFPLTYGGTAVMSK